jgi:hypothetical protein
MSVDEMCSVNLIFVRNDYDFKPKIFFLYHLELLSTPLRSVLTRMAHLIEGV